VGRGEGGVGGGDAGEDFGDGEALRGGGMLVGGEMGVGAGVGDVRLSDHARAHDDGAAT